MRNQFLTDEDLLPFNGKRNVNKNEKPIPSGLALASIQWPKELKEVRETNFLRIKTCFQSMARAM